MNSAKIVQVDVVLLTKNSFKPCLKECLESIGDNLPINRLIIVDGGSTDETISFISDFCQKTILNFYLSMINSVTEQHQDRKESIK